LNTLKIDGKQFRDLDHDGKLAPYEDWRLPAKARAKDLVDRLTLNEKIGLMLHGTLQATGGPMGVLGIGPEYDAEHNGDLILNKHVSSMISRLALSPCALAEQNNEIQKIAARSRLGIPATISTDPRHHRSAATGAGVTSNGFTLWPGPLGLAASRDMEIVRLFGDIVRQEYRATGLHVALSPQADLATSPRWSRMEGTFGEDPDLVRQLVGAYVDGVQGGTTGLHNASVAAVVKHWVGYGAAPDGFDGHNYYGRYSTFSGGALDEHIRAFLAAFTNQVAGVMPTYNILKDLQFNGEVIEQVGAGYSKELLTDLLRGTHQFDGVVLSDWAITRDVNDTCRFGGTKQMPWDISMAWGVEDLCRAERFAKGLNAGLDQFGGEDDPEPMKEAIAAGWVSEERLNQSAYRILLQKFELGLFEQPFVDADAAGELVGNATFTDLAKNAAKRSFVFLKNTPTPTLTETAKVYLKGFQNAQPGEVEVKTVENPSQADLAIVKLNTPYQTLHPDFFFGSRQHEGDLDFKADSPELIELKDIANQVPTIIVIEMDRPAILTNLADLTNVLVASFGGDDEVLFELLKGNAETSGVLPFSLPRSMEEVVLQTPDKPLEDTNPLFPLGHGERMRK